MQLNSTNWDDTCKFLNSFFYKGWQRQENSLQEVFTIRASDCTEATNIIAHEILSYFRPWVGYYNQPQELLNKFSMKTQQLNNNIVLVSLAIFDESFIEKLSTISKENADSHSDYKNLSSAAVFLNCNLNLLINSYQHCWTIKNNQLILAFPYLAQNSQLAKNEVANRIFFSLSPWMGTNDRKEILDKFSIKMVQKDQNCFRICLCISDPEFINKLSSAFEKGPPPPIDDEEKLHSLVEQVKNKSISPSLALNLLHFVLTNNQPLRLELAEIFAGIDRIGTIKAIKTLKLDEKSKTKLAITCLPHSLNLENFYNFDFKDRELFIEFAKEAAKKFPKDLALFMDKFYITTKNALAYGIESENTTGITDENLRYEIAHTMLKFHPECTDLITYFNFIDCEKLKTLAFLSGGYVAKCIDKFSIADEQTRIFLAKDAIEKGPNTLAKNIKAFSITDENIRYEIAYALFQKNPALISYIDNFEINDREKLEKLALLVGGYVAKCIDKFSIADEQTRIFLAKDAIEKEPNPLAENIKAFSITHENIRYEIAHALFQKNPAFIQYIDNFEINDPEKLEKLAFLGSSYVGPYLDNFNIADEKVRIALAEKAINEKLANPRKSFGIAQDLKKFNISDKNALLQLAILCAKAEPQSTVINIDNFGIENQDDLLDILKKCMDKDLYHTASNLHLIKNISEQSLKELVRLCFQKNLFCSNLEQLSLPLDKNLTAIFIFSDEEFCKSPQETKELLLKAFNANFAYTSFVTLLEEIDRHVHSREEKMEQLAKCLLLMQLLLTKEQISRVCELKIVENLLAFGRSNLRVPIAHEIFSYFSKQPNHAEQLLAHLKNSTMSKQWIQLLLAKFELEGISSATTQKIWNIIKPRDSLFSKGVNSQIAIELLVSLLCKNTLTNNQKTYILEKILSESYAAAQIPAKNRIIDQAEIAEAKIKLIENLKTIAEDTNTNEMTKRQLLKDLIALQKGNTRRQLEAIVKNDVLKPAIEQWIKRQASDKKIHVWQNMIALKQQAQQGSSVKATKEEYEIEFLKAIQVTIALFSLKKDSFIIDSVNSSLVEILEQEFKAVIQLDHIDNLVGKYAKTFGRSKYPMAVMTYAAKMNSLKKPQALEAYSQFVTQVLEETFTNNRYQLTTNPHLSTVELLSPGIVKQWAQAIAPMDVEALANERPQQFDYDKWLKLKLINDRHFPLDLLQQDLFISFLDTQDETLRTKCYDQAKANPTPAIKLQKLLFELYHEKNSNQQIGFLRSISKHLKEFFPDVEFINDVDSLVHNLQQNIVGEAKVYDSDSPYDLFLCGSVGDSCQNINGNPNLNVGLLGYTLDGKNRILAVFDNDDNMLCRCIIRLLQDGKQVVMHRERFYPFSAPEAHKDALNAMAMKKAQAIGVPVVCSDGTGDFYGKALYSEGGPAPWEYCDAAYGLCDNGKFIISSDSLRLLQA